MYKPNPNIQDYYNGQMEFSKNICELMNRLFDEADNRMLESLCRPEDFKLSIPEFLHRHVQQAFSMYYQMNMAAPAVTWYLRGVEIIPSEDLAITLFHKDYPLYGYDWMVRKIPLSNPKKQMQDWYTEYVFTLTEGISYFIKKENPDLN